MLRELAAFTIEGDDVHQGGVRAGHERDQRNQNDRDVLGHGPAA